MTEIGAAMLDFDGVLAESNTAKVSAFEDLFARYAAYRGAMMKYHLVKYSKPRMAKFEYYVYDLLWRPGDVNVV